MKFHVRALIALAIIAVAGFASAGSNVGTDDANALVSPPPLLDPALESQLDDFIREVLSNGARNAPTRVRGTLVLSGHAAAGEIPAITRGIPICASGVAAVACIGGAGYVGWRIGGALNRWLGISASFLPPYNSTTTLTGASWGYAEYLDSFISGAPHEPGRYVRGVTSSGVGVDVGRILCNSTRTGPGDQPCSEFYRQFELLLNSQPGTVVRWGTGTQACGYGTCYAKYRRAGEFNALLEVDLQPYTGQRVDWSDLPPAGVGTITSVERQRYRDAIQSSPQAPAPANYVNFTLDPEHWYPPTSDPAENGGVRPDWTMPNCVGLTASACKTLVTNTALTAKAYVLPAFADRVYLPLMNRSYEATAVLRSTPIAGATGKFTTITLDENPNPLPILLPASTPGEAYAQYVARLRNLGWLGTAVVVQLDSASGDPDFGADAVPCRNVPATVPINPGTAIKLFRNPLTFTGQSGGSSSGWDCSGHASPPTANGCEYDANWFSEYDWETGRTYGEAAYDQACTDAWALFNLSSGMDPLTGQRLATGKIKDPDVRDFLTGDGQSTIDDWVKVEWGPLTVTSRGQRLAFVVHAYQHVHTGEVRGGPYAKLKFRTEIEPGP